MAKSSNPLVISDLRYGRDGKDPSLLLPESACTEAYNVDFYASILGQKRSGSTAMTLWASPSVDYVASTFMHVPAADLTAAEFWATTYHNTTYAVTLRRLTTAGWSVPTWTDPSEVITVGSLGQNVNGCSFNGKLFLTLTTTPTNRLHVWDGLTVRRVGIGQPSGHHANVCVHIRAPKRALAMAPRHTPRGIRS